MIIIVLYTPLMPVCIMIKRCAYVCLVFTYIYCHIIVENNDASALLIWQHVHHVIMKVCVKNVVSTSQIEKIQNTCIN